MVENEFPNFWKHVDKRGPEECWPWKATKTRAGYGQVTIGGKKFRATHIALAADGRPRPTKLYALHSCDNPNCVNPAHLRWGTHADNVADAVSRNRVRGERNPKARLTEADVLAIRADPRTSPPVAKEYGLSPRYVREIRSRVYWTHLEEGKSL